MGHVSAAFHAAALGKTQHFEIIVITFQGSGRGLRFLQMLQNLVHGHGPVLRRVDGIAVNAAGLLAWTDAKIVKEPLAEGFVDLRGGFGIVHGGQSLHQQLAGRLRVGFRSKTEAADLRGFLVAAAFIKQLGCFLGGQKKQVLEVGADGYYPAVRRLVA